MTVLQTRREYLVGLGLAKPGKGKFSNLAKEALAKADAEGYEFLDGPSPKGNGGGPILSTAPEAKPAPADPRDSLYLSPSDFRYPEDEWRAVAKVDNKRVVYSMRECCNVCGCSLTNHMCNTPSVLGFPVTIERR